MILGISLSKNLNANTIKNDCESDIIICINELDQCNHETKILRKDVDTLKKALLNYSKDQRRDNTTSILMFYPLGFEIAQQRRVGFFSFQLGLGFFKLEDFYFKSHLSLGINY